MKTLLRSFWFATSAVVYVAFAALEAHSRNYLTWIVLFGAIVVLWLTWRYTKLAENVLDSERLAQSNAKRAAVTGALLFALARTGPIGHSGFDAIANLGVGITLVSACVALSRIVGRGGLLTAPRGTQSLDSAIMGAMLWGLATTLPALRTLLPTTILALDPLALDYATVSAAMASLLLLLATTARLTHLRRLEYAVSDRATSTLIVSAVALLATIPALLLDLVPPDRAVPAVVVVASLFHVWAASAADARQVTASLRGTLAILSFLSPVVLILAVLAQKAPHHAPLLLVATAAVSVVLGLVAARLSRPLAPEQARWLDAIERASEAALMPNPEDALRATLEALSPTAPGPSTRVELWRLDPPSVQYVDIAGQLHEESALVPNSVISLSEREPERTLRADVLRAVQVRNTQAREALAYFDTRKVYACTLLTSETEPLGFLALPRSYRKSPLSLEECGALRRLSDRLESVLAITSAQARSRKRELQALARVTDLENENTRLAAVLTGTGLRHKRFVERYALRLRPQLYSSISRQTQGELERLAKSSREALLVLPPGTDAQSWASLFHLASVRNLGPFVVFDSGTGDFDKELWDDPERSPLAIAETGTWVLLDPQSLTTAQQEILVSAIVRWKATQVIESLSPMGYILGVHLANDQSISTLPILDSLRALFPEHSTITVPSLQSRPEDLRAIIQERIARLGNVLRGRALGVDSAALVELLEYDWPLNDLELESTLAHLVLSAEGACVTTGELERIGFGVRVETQNTQGLYADDDKVRPRRPRVMTRSVRPKAR